MLYEQIEPFGGRRGDVQAGIVAAAVCNVFGGRGAQPASPLDFMPNWDSAEMQAQSLEEQEKIFDKLTIKQNAIVEARKAHGSS